ncbi:MAG: V-type ATP synthase subunit F [Vallitaleaceae bacterium]|nr:V-type ATP synthase subunit F [Vallitaleaceae bacterium]
MKMYLISDNIDTLTGMRLAGIDGVVVHAEKEIEEELDRILRDREVGVLLVTEIINHMVEKRIAQIKLEYATPLIVVVPDRHGSTRGLDSITKYVREAIGLKI